MGESGNRKQEARAWKSRYRPYIVAGVLAFIMTMFLAPEVNEGNAMAPTIKDGQVALILKTSYSVNRGVPKLGQVVLLQKDENAPLQQDNVFGRVIGLPGDTVEGRKGKVYRNGKEYKGKGGRIAALGSKPQGKWKVGKEEVFLVCDNATAATDSRPQLPSLINMKQIKGDAKCIIWPLSNIGGIQ